MPSNQQDTAPELRPHSYDGIQEYDQKLPNWWLFTFYIAIAYFIIYWLGYYQFKLLSTDEERMDQAMAHIESVRMKQLESLDDPKLWAMSQDAKAVEAGKVTFNTACIACHGPKLMGGPGLPGLALADKKWKYSGKPTDVLKLVRKGSPDITKGMPAWEPQLGLPRVLEVVAYVMSHHKEGENFTIDPNEKPPGLPLGALPAAALPAAVK